MKSTRTKYSTVVAALMVLPILSGCANGDSVVESAGAESRDQIVVAADTSVESSVLAEVYSTVLSSSGLSARVESVGGGRTQSLEALDSARVTLMPEFTGALLDHSVLIDTARQHGGQIVVPTGALIGLDAVTAAAEGKINSVRMVTRKPVKGLAGAPYLLQNNIKIEDITAPTKIFDGTAREAAKGFPANLNVAVALSLAGIGPDLTRLEIWADPALTRNHHRIEVDADSASFSMAIENIPSDNPKTGRITALSVIAYLRKRRAPLRVGT